VNQALLSPLASVAVLAVQTAVYLPECSMIPALWTNAIDVGVLCYFAGLWRWAECWIETR